MSELSVGSLSGLAANSYVVDIASGSTLDLSNATDLPASALPAGSILQVVSTTKTDQFTTSSTSYTDVTGLSVSITPRSTSSKIFVMVQTNVGGDSSSYQAIQLVRDSTAINIGDAAGSRTRASYMSYNGGTTDGENYYGSANVHLSTLDSPSTTSTVTYKVQAKTNTSNLKINSSGADSDSSVYGRMASTITAIEVAG